MLHSSDPAKNHQKKPYAKDFGSKHSYSHGMEKFYLQDKLSEDGFIFPDGSLRFEFFVKKHNYMKRLEISEAKNTDLKTEIERLKQENV